jgi:hypothetical protein
LFVFFRKMLLIQTDGGPKSMSGKGDDTHQQFVRRFLSARWARDVLIIPRKDDEDDDNMRNRRRQPAGPEERRRDVRAIVRYKPTQRYGLWGGYFNIFQWVSFSLCVSAAAVPLEIGCTVKPRKEKKKKKKLFFFWRNNQLDPIYMLI